MKRILSLSLLILIAVSSCQKQDATAEQQLDKRKAELDAREKALDEREQALAAREKSAATSHVVRVPRSRSAQPQRSIPPELKGLIVDPSQRNAEREQMIQERLAIRQRRIEELRKMRAAGSLPPPQGIESGTASPTPSPTPE